MPYDPERHHRQSIRWRSQDYAGGGTYFVTLVTQDRICLFGDVRDGELHLSALGLIVDREWARAGVIRPEVSIDVFTVMPNHLHGLVSINPVNFDPTPDRGIVGAHGCVPSLDVTDVGVNNSNKATSDRAHSGVPLRRKRSLSSIVAQFKATSTVAINNQRGTQGAKVWQRNFHEHVVRTGEEFDQIAYYIVTNPERWNSDEHNPDIQ